MFEDLHVLLGAWAVFLVRKNKWEPCHFYHISFWQLLVLVPGGGQKLPVCLPGGIRGSALWGSEKPLCQQSVSEQWPLSCPARRVCVWMPAGLHWCNLRGEDWIQLAVKTAWWEHLLVRTHLYLLVFHLQVQSDPCSPNPCHNKAQCHSLMGDFYCSCPDDYEGKTCSELKDHCKTNQCQGNTLN